MLSSYKSSLSLSHLLMSSCFSCIIALCCHSNESRVPIANSPNSAQLGGTLYISPSYIRVCAVVWARGDGQTHRQTHTQTSVTNIHFMSSKAHAKCNYILPELCRKFEDSISPVPNIGRPTQNFKKTVEIWDG